MLPEMGDDAGRARSKREETISIKVIGEGGKEEAEERTEFTF